MTTPNDHPFYDEAEDQEKREPVDFETMIAALQTEEGEEGALSAAVYYGLSGLTSVQITQLQPIWDALEVDYRERVITELTETSETNYDLDYREVARLALRDESGDVRAVAIELLWDDNSLEHMRELMTLAANDPSEKVRAAAASASGRFVLHGELGDLPLEETNQAQALMESIYRNTGEDIDVRRRALEALANSSNDSVAVAIKEAYASSDRRLQVSAVFAMGRSCDEQWTDTVLQELSSQDAEMRYEAARAAGELEIEDAVPTLGELATDDNDREVQDVAVWSLGEIGGNEALRTLNKLAREAQQLKDEEMLEAIEDAISSASLGSGAMYIFDMNDSRN